MSYILLLFFGFLPSIIWLLFYLRKDKHPESNKKIIKVFFFGMLIAIPTALIELGVLDQIGIIKDLPAFVSNPFLFLALKYFLVVALLEELMKYLIVKKEVFSAPEFDEPVDIILYMIICALGFAAVENILTLLPPKEIAEALSTIWIRFIGATLLHTLCSAMLGYFLALSFFETKKRNRLAVVGLILAITLHGFYDLSIMTEGSLNVLGPMIILIGLAIFVSFGFKKVKKLKSVCKI